jgi:hypothetical protein
LDTKWRKANCGLCVSGIKFSAGAEPDECDCGGGIVYLRPKGHAFAWPGGPACGWWDEKEYEAATPVMPFDWHYWKETDDEIAAMSLTRMGDLEKSNIIHCICGFIGTIGEDEIHRYNAEQAFIAEHRTPIA